MTLDHFDCSLLVSTLIPETRKRIRPLMLWPSDGGGVRGLSSLYILRAIMRALERELDEAEGAEKLPARRVLPCDYFDLIAGTSTGG